MSSLPGATAKNIRFLSRCDQGGRLDGVQVIVEKGHAFIGHMFSDGFSVIDVRDPLKPKTVAFVAAPKNTRSHHLQIHGDILLAVNGPNIWAMQQYASQAGLLRQIAGRLGTDRAAVRRRHARVRYLEAGEPARDRLSRHCPASARIASGGSAAATPMSRCISKASSITCLAVVDVSDPHKPTLAGKWWLPGMNRAGGETPPASFGKRTALHHLISAGNLGYAAWRDGGFTDSRSERSAQSETAQPPQLRAALRRRRAHAVAAAGPQAAGARRRGDVGELRQWARLYLADRRARAGKSGVDRDAADAGRRGFLRQGREIRPAQPA